MAKRILAFLLCFALMEVALAHPPGTGSVSYAHDLKPMIDKNPLLAELLKENFSIANDMAMGTRIGDETAPAIDGARIGPYYVDAVWHSKHGNKPVSLTIYTDVQFFDASGKLLGNDFHNATRIVETFSGISIEEPDD
jgi:hypothetical protein